MFYVRNVSFVCTGKILKRKRRSCEAFWGTFCFCACYFADCERLTCFFRRNWCREVISARRRVEEIESDAEARKTDAEGLGQVFDGLKSARMDSATQRAKINGKIY